MQETWDPGSIIGGEDPLEEEMAAHSSNLAWRVPWTGQPGGLLSTGLESVGHDWKELVLECLEEMDCSSKMTKKKELTHVGMFVCLTA